MLCGGTLKFPSFGGVPEGRGGFVLIAPTLWLKTFYFVGAAAPYAAITLALSLMAGSRRRNGADSRKQEGAEGSVLRT